MMKRTNSEIPNARLTAAPELRFPEFRDSPSWKGEQLASIAEPVSERADNEVQHNILTLSGEHGLVLQSEYFGKQIAGTSSDRYLRIERDDFVYNDRTTKASAYGTIKRLKHHPHGIVSPIYKCFRFKDGQLPSFWEWYFESGAHEKQLCGLANEGARAGRFNVSIDRFLSTIAFAPDAQSAEQAKIADCLSSLDELIGAESQKLDALKTHKKGLMQQLFPREGETLPGRRFPEFHNAPKWEQRMLCEVTAAVFDGTHRTPTYVESGVPFYSVENLISGNANKFISREDYAVATRKNKPEKGDILLTRIGRVGHSSVVTWEHDFSVYVTLAVIKRSELFASHYLHFFFQSDRYQAELRSKSLPNAVPPKINLDSLRATIVLLPKVEEQQRIAACLSSLDDLIVAQSNQIEALKTHKQGLMQQLFPSPAEAEE